MKGEALAGNAVDKRDGGQHMLKFMANNSYTDNSIWIDRKFSYVSPQIVNRDKEFDIYLGNTNPNAIWFVECKSYAETTPIDVDQFIAYLSAINNLSNLRYVFNAKKLTLQQAKEKMQTVFRNNVPTIFNALNPIGKFQQLFGVQTTQQFLAKVNNLSDAIYDFVITN